MGSAMDSRARARSRGKAFESRVAKFFQTRRTPLSGINSGHTGSDTLHPDLFIECKHHGDPSIWRWYNLAKAADTWCGVFVVVDLAREEKTYFVSHVKDWTATSALSSADVAEKAHTWIEGQPPVHEPWVYTRHGTATGSLLYNTREKAKKENKIPMLALGCVGRKGFLVVVHSNEWDRARQYKGEAK